MNTIFVIDLIYLLLFLALPAALICRVVVERSGTSGNAAMTGRNHSENQSFYNLIIPKIPIDQWPKLVVHSCPSVCFVVKSKTKPKQSQTKPIFQGSIFDFSKKMRIFDKFRQYFLCKTKPNCLIGISGQWSMSCQKRVIMQNKANLYIFFTWITNEVKRTYSDFYQEKCQKNKANLNILLTFS